MATLDDFCDLSEAVKSDQRGSKRKGNPLHCDTCAHTYYPEELPDENIHMPEETQDEIIPMHYSCPTCYKELSFYPQDMETTERSLDAQQRARGTRYSCDGVSTQTIRAHQNTSVPNPKNIRVNYYTQMKQLTFEFSKVAKPNSGHLQIPLEDLTADFKKLKQHYPDENDEIILTTLLTKKYIRPQKNIPNDYSVGLGKAPGKQSKNETEKILDIVKNYQ